MFCPNCGEELKDGARFCTGCGTELARYAIPKGTQANRSDGATASERTTLPDDVATPDENSSRKNERDDVTAAEVTRGDDEDDARKDGKARKAGISALLASTVQLAGVAVPAFALVMVGAVAVAAIVGAIVWGVSANRPSEEAPSQEQPVEGGAGQTENTHEESEQERINREAHAALNGIVEEYRQVLQSENPAELLSSLSAAEHRQQASAEYPHVAASSFFEILNPTSDTSDLENVRYAFADLDDDGTDELVIETGPRKGSPSTIGTVLAVHDFRNGTAETVLSSTYRDRYTLCEDNAFEEAGIDGAIMRNWSFHKLNSDGTLTEIERVSINGMSPNGDLRGSHTVRGEVVEETSEPMTREIASTSMIDTSGLMGTKAMELAEKVISSHPARTDLDWQKF